MDLKTLKAIIICPHCKKFWIVKKRRHINCDLNALLAMGINKTNCVKPKKRDQTMQTNTDGVMEAFERLSSAALMGDEADRSCTVNKNDLATVLLAYRLELGNTNKDDNK